MSSSAIGKRKAPVDYRQYFIQDHNANDNNTNDKSFKPDTTTQRRRRQQSTPTSTTSTSTSTSDKITDKETTITTTTRKNKSSATTIELQAEPILWWGYNVVKGEKKHNWYRAIKHPNGAVEKKPVREAEVPIERLLLEDWNALSEREKRRKYGNDFDNYVAVVRS